MSSKNRTSLVADGPLTSLETDLVANTETPLWNGQRHTPIKSNGRAVQMWRLHASGLYNFAGNVTFKTYFGEFIESPNPGRWGDVSIPSGHNGDSARWYMQMDLAANFIQTDEAQISLGLGGYIALADGSLWMFESSQPGFIPNEDINFDTFLTCTLKSDQPDAIVVRTLSLESLN